MNAITLSAIACFCSLLIMGCGDKQMLTSADFPGPYVARFPHGVENLVLHENGTYSQSYVSNGKAHTQTNAGHWEFHTAPTSFIHLKNVHRFDGNRPNTSITTDLGLNVKVWRDGTVELVLSEEEALSYKKQKLP